MKVLRYCVLVLVLLAAQPVVYGQCAMCSANAENSVKNGNTQGRGLNDGILYLLAAPYLAIAAIGYLWYKKYRKKSEVGGNTQSTSMGFNTSGNGHS